MTTRNETCWCGGRVETRIRNGRQKYEACAASEFHDPFATGRPDAIHKLYVAGPMSGYADCNYPAFNNASAWLRSFGFEVVNPAEFGSGSHYVDFLREDIRLMLDCHGVAVLENWWESAGARNEVQVAGLLRMPVRPVGEWVNRAKEELGDRYRSRMTV